MARRRSKIGGAPPKKFRRAWRRAAADTESHIRRRHFGAARLRGLLMARVLGYALGAYKVFKERVVVETSKRSHLIGN